MIAAGMAFVHAQLTTTQLANLVSQKLRVKHLMITYFLTNISVKNCVNWLVYMQLYVRVEA